MALKVSKADKFVSEMSFDMEGAEKRMDDALTALSVAVSTYNGLAGKYQAFIEALALEDSGNATWAEKQARVAAYVEEFGIMKAWAVAVKTAATGVAKP